MIEKRVEEIEQQLEGALTVLEMLVAQMKKITEAVNQLADNQSTFENLIGQKLPPPNF